MKKKMLIFFFILAFVGIGYGESVLKDGELHKGTEDYITTEVGQDTSDNISSGDSSGNTNNKDVADDLDLTNDDASNETTGDFADEVTSAQEEKINNLISDMTLEEKVGQLFMLRPEALEFGLNFNQVNDVQLYGATAVNEEMISNMQQYHVGGIILFAKNIIEPEQLTSFISDLQAGSDIPLFISVDEEGGTVSRVGNNPRFDVIKYSSMQSVASSGDITKAYEVGLNIGSYLTDYGFNLDYAPVADVNTNPRNIVIGNRAFGSDPVLVADMVSSAISGFHDSGIMTCAKHFPGHGDTTNDTHKDTVFITKSWEEISQCELIPFVAAIHNGCDLIMVSHISAPN
ncbi:MAG: glycoside hydrolase family 3 N-terminal domain-containing protein, partial [Wujia sp.]